MSREPHLLYIDAVCLRQVQCPISLRLCAFVLHKGQSETLFLQGSHAFYVLLDVLSTPRGLDLGVARVVFSKFRPVTHLSAVIYQKYQLYQVNPLLNTKHHLI